MKTTPLSGSLLRATQQVGNPESPPAWLVSKLQALYATLPFVEAARLLVVYSEGDLSKGVLTLAITTTKAHAERTVRATITAIQPECRSANLPLDILSTPSDVPDPQFIGSGILIYARDR